MNNLLVLKLVCLFSSISALKEFPPFLPRCSLTNPKIIECFLNATETARPYIIRGEILEFVPKLTPLFIPELEFQQGSQSVTFKASLKDVSLYGLEQYKFTGIDFQMTSKTSCFFVLTAEFEKIYIEGNYFVEGQILGAPLKGNGLFHGNISNTGFTAKVYMDLVKKNNLTYYVPKPSEYNARIGNIVDYGIKGLFKENKVLATAIDKVIQDNLDLLVVEITPSINEVIKKLLDEYVFKKVTRYPLEVLHKV